MVRRHQNNPNSDLSPPIIKTACDLLVLILVGGKNVEISQKQIDFLYCIYLFVYILHIAYYLLLFLLLVTESVLMNHCCLL